MDQLGPPAFNPHLKRVLDTYQNAAVRSLSGPSSYVAGWGDPSKMSPAEMDEYRMKVISTLTGKKPGRGDELLAVVSGVGGVVTGAGGGGGVNKPHDLCAAAAPPFPIQQVPLFMPMDSSRSEKSETILEGETIACFIVGGEKRLCLPQILNTVLRDFSLQQINVVCDDLHIFCSRCNPEQLDNLKMTHVLPLSAPSCGLITKTDAERLCNALLHAAPEKSAEPPTPNSFKVYHECFGKCKGIFTPELYTAPQARCIECCGCRGLFCPQKFVCHSHSAQENRTCHWGFDSANWRSYLLLSKDQDNKPRLQDVLEMIKARFDFMSKYKRKESPSLESSDSKRARYEDGKCEGGYEAGTWPEGSLPHMSAFQPWGASLLNALKEGKTLQIPQQLRDGIATALPAFLQTGPPVLLNPERVIPHSESTRYERHFAPNVSLAPQAQQKTKIKEETSEDREKDSDMAANDSELNLSSDTEDSVYENPATVESLPPLSGENSTAEGNNSYNLSKELALIRTALNGEVANTDTAREKFIKDYIDIRRQQLEEYSAVLARNRSLEREVESLRSCKQHLMELTAENQILEKELDALRCEHEKKMAKMRANVESLHRERENAAAAHNHKSPDVLKNKAKYKAQISDLKMRLRLSEQTNVHRDQELSTLRSECQKLGVQPPSPPRHAHNNNTSAAPTAAPSGGNKCKELLNGRNGDLLISVKKEPSSDTEQSSQATP